MATSSTEKKKSKPAKAAKDNTTEAKSRFNAALEEAKAGASALTAEAKERGAAYRAQAMTKGEDWTAEAKTKAGELAVEGKAKVSEGMTSLGKVVGDTAEKIDEKFGTKYGDYARSASRSLQEGATKLDGKSVEEIGEDAREMVRKSPGLAVGLAAVAGFMIARMFRGR